MLRHGMRSGWGGGAEASTPSLVGRMRQAAPPPRSASMSAPFDSVIAMPGSHAKRGDIYRVDRDATIEGDRKKERPMICVAEQPLDEYVWTAMTRTTSPEVPSAELESPINTDVGLTQKGWWSYRRIRSVKKRWTGHLELCKYLGRLPDTEKDEVLEHYMNRPKPAPNE